MFLEHIHVHIQNASQLYSFINIQYSRNQQFTYIVNQIKHKKHLEIKILQKQIQHTSATE